MSVILRSVRRPPAFSSYTSLFTMVAQQKKIEK